MKQDCTLVEDCNSFEMYRMTVRTDQLFCIAAATNSQIYTRDMKAKAHGQAKTLVLSLKQYHAYYYHFHEKGMTRAMVVLQGLHSSDTFRCSNVSFSVGLKSFCPWYFKLGGNTKGSALPVGHHLSHLPACLHRACWSTTQDVRPNVWKNMQNKKDLRWKVAQEEVKGVRVGNNSFLKLVWVALMNTAGQKDAWHFQSNSAEECGLIYPLDLPKSFCPCILSRFLLNCMNCYFFVSTNMLIVPWCFG